MDTKGREELLGMQTCSSYQGCPVCTLKFTAGRCVGRKGIVCDGYRCFLSSTSRARQKRFTYRGIEYHYQYVLKYTHVTHSHSTHAHSTHAHVTHTHTLLTHTSLTHAHIAHTHVTHSHSLKQSLPRTVM